MQNITILKKELLKTIEENMKIHVKEYNESHRVYTELAIQAALDLAEKLKENSKSVDLFVNLQEPKSNEQDYLTAIEMLKWEISDTVTITENEFKNFIKDEWTWSRSFAVSKATYLS